MRAVFIAVGSEMLERDTVDTNSIYVQQRLMEYGILTDMKVVVRDDLPNLSWIIKSAFKRVQLLVISGGLGPTEDDMTREATAAALNRELEFQEEIVEGIEARFNKRGTKMPRINMRQAFVLQGSEVVPNTLGSAPGLYIDDPECKVLLLPGPPSEMKAMFDRVLVEKIAPLSNFFIYKRSFKISGLGESDVDEQIAELYTQYKNPKTTILSSPGVIDVHLLGRSRKSVDEAQVLTDELAEKIKERMEKHLLNETDTDIETHIVNELKRRNLTLAVAESCTGGGLGALITDVPGSSEIFLGGVIAYANDLKIKLLGVEEETLLKQGAVSKETAAQMARGVRELTGADLGVGITGIAGPGGETVGKPVGMVYMHLSAEGSETGMYKIFPGPRKGVKKRAAVYCLDMINRFLKENK